MTDLAIDITGASKTYRGGLLQGKGVRALRGVDMKVHKGEVFGLLGPNGAGKSTLVKILMTVIRASACEGTVLGRAVGDKHALARVGYLPEHHRFPNYLKGWQVLDFYGAMAGVPRRDRKKRIGELLELVGMGDWAKKRIKQYSKGMRQRVGLAQALMNDPELVLLDEPTDGVDPVGRRDIRGICQRLKEEGRTVFLNSHLLSELEMVCDRVAIMVQGVIASQGTIDELTVDQRHYEIGLAGSPDFAGVKQAVGRVFGGEISSDEAKRTLTIPTAGGRPDPGRDRRAAPAGRDDRVGQAPPALAGGSVHAGRDRPGDGRDARARRLERQGPDDDAGGEPA